MAKKNSWSETLFFPETNCRERNATRKIKYACITALYPELWNRKTITKDIVLMKTAGINVVRMGEFIWSTIEPKQDDFHVEFLEV